MNELTCIIIISLFSVAGADIELNTEFSYIENIDIDILKLEDGFVYKQTGDLLSEYEIGMLSNYVENLWGILTDGTLSIKNEYMLKKSYYYICAYMLMKSNNDSKISDLIITYYNVYTYEQNLMCVYNHIKLLMRIINSMIDSKILNLYDVKKILEFIKCPDNNLCNPTKKSFDEIIKELSVNNDNINVNSSNKKDIVASNILLTRIENIGMHSLSDINTLSKLWMKYSKRLKRAYQFTSQFLDSIDVCILRLYCEIYGMMVATSIRLQNYCSNDDICEINNYNTYNHIIVNRIKTNNGDIYTLNILPYSKSYKYTFSSKYPPAKPGALGNSGTDHEISHNDGKGNSEQTTN